MARCNLLLALSSYRNLHRGWIAFARCSHDRGGFSANNNGTSNGLLLSPGAVSWTCAGLVVTHQAGVFIACEDYFAMIFTPVAKTKIGAYEICCANAYPPFLI
jgi:hypothetical protein